MKEVKRPDDLDKRVFFCKDLPKNNFIHEHDLLWLYLSKESRSNKFQWSFQFDIVNSGSGRSVAFTKDELNQIIEICESKSFDWNSRTISSHSSYIAYLYLELVDAVEVANRVANFVYELHNNQPRRLLINEICEGSYKSDEELIIHIFKERESGQYELAASHGLDLEILMFKNGKPSIKRKVEASIIYQSEYSHDQAIKESNLSRQDGILLINYHTKQSEFYATDWNTFCLTIDKRKFTKSGEPINDYGHNIVEQLSIDSKEYSDFSNDRIEDLLSNEVAISVNDLDVNKSFREGTTFQVTVNIYERNPQARKKCIDYYGTSCFVCEFNFGKAFGKLGEGFIHVHHLKPISEIGEEYEVNPIEDMRTVCPNCHAMIHRRTPLLSIEKIKKLYFAETSR